MTRNIAIASSAALVLGLIRLGTPSLWVDEAFTARAVRTPFTDLFDGYHWLYYSIEKPWSYAAGTSEVALRLPSVVGAMLAGALLVVLAHRLFGSSVALVSGLLLATNPFVVKWSQQARGYTLLVAVVLLATLLLVRALDRGTRAAWATYGLVISAAVLWHPVSGLVVLPAHALLAYERRGRLLPHGLLAVTIVGALAVPSAIVVSVRSVGQGVAMNWLTFPSLSEIVHAVLDVSGIAGLGVAFAILGLVLLARRGSSNALWLGTWAAAPFLLALLVSVVRPVYLDRYLIVTSPAFALLAGFALVHVGGRLRTTMALVVVGATAVALVQWYSLGVDGNWRGEDWRSATRAVLSRSDPSTAIVVAEWAANPAAVYYGAEVSDVATADSIWVLTWSESDPELRPAERRALGFGGHRRVESMSFGRRLRADLWRRSP